MTEQESAEHERQIEKDILRLEELKDQKQEIEAEIADIEKYLDKTVDKDHSFETEDGARVTAVVVRGYLDRFDDHLISTRYKGIWESITRRKMDKALYLDAVRSGVISPELHKRFHTQVPKKAYVLVNRTKPEGSE
jgi:hypothetical protein